MGEASLPHSERLSEHVPRRALGLLPDSQLSRLAAEDSRQAFAAIYERHHQALYRYCRSILGNDEDAQDALQNTMVSALRALPGETREIALQPWLFRVAHNEAISVLRRRSGGTALEEAEELAAVETDPAVRERLRTLFSDLQQLPDRQRGALVMRELNGLDYGAIGAALDTSKSAAKQIVYEARCALHELEEGREMSCDAARQEISARDGRKLRGRKLRAHLRSCDGCRAFKESIAGRQTALSALAPPLPAPAAAALLAGIFGGGGGGGTGGGIAALATGAAGQSMAGTAALKAAVVVFMAAIGATGAGLIVGADDPVSEAAVDRRDEAPGGGSGSSQLTNANGEAPNGGSQWLGAAGSGDGSSPGGEGSGWPGGGAPASPSDGGAGGGVAGVDVDPGGGAGTLDPDSPAPDPPAESPSGGGGDPSPGGGGGGGSGGGGGGGSSGGGSSGGGGPTKPPAGGGSPDGGPIGTPPGHGGTPPGQGGIPPGLVESPPGLGGTPPGLGGTAPGQQKQDFLGGAAPGQE